jgi:hypothetical protein
VQEEEIKPMYVEKVERLAKLGGGTGGTGVATLQTAFECGKRCTFRLRLRAITWSCCT